MKTIHVVLAFGLFAAPGFAVPAGAQSVSSDGVSRNLPVSTKPANTGYGDVRSSVAPPLPTPVVGEDASAMLFLQNARTAVATGHTGEAQEALERAQTRRLDRGVEMRRTEEPSGDPVVADITRARAALGAGDKQAALREIDAAIARVR